MRVITHYMLSNVSYPTQRMNYILQHYPAVRNHRYFLMKRPRLISLELDNIERRGKAPP